MKIFWENRFWSLKLVLGCLKIVIGFFYSLTIYKGWKQVEKTQYICWEVTQKRQSRNIAVGKNQKKILLSVDWPVDRQQPKIWLLGLTVDRSVDRVTNPESKALQQSTCRSTMTQQYQKILQSVDRSVDRCVHKSKANFVQHRSTGQSTDRAICSAYRSTDSGKKSGFENLLKCISFL